MLPLQTDIEGKKAYYGDIKETFKKSGFCIGGNWDYDRGSFDSILHRDRGETIYIRLPFQVIEGELDSRHAYIEFQKPYVIKHVVNIGLDHEGTSLLGAVVNQFQAPLDKDGSIEDKSKWEREGEKLVSEIMTHIYH